MGFDVFGPTRHVRASTSDDGGDRPYDILALPKEFGLRCPQIERLNQRFYDSTVILFALGEVHALRDELIHLVEAYRMRREPELIVERRIRACDPKIRRAILEQVLLDDPHFRALDGFRLLCEEAIENKADVRCEGD
jgi:hypothetical protein